jgi:DNA-binding NtrC family response regulator
MISENIKRAKILVVDDEQVMLDVLSKLLRDDGFEVETAATGKEALEKIKNNSYQLLIQDIQLPDINGLDVLKETRIIKEDIPVIMVTAYGSIDTAVQAMKLGAKEYLTKPFDNEEVLLQVHRSLEFHQLKKKYKSQLNEMKSKFSFENIIGKNSKMLEIFELIQSAAPSKSTILIRGESGTGKEMIAGAIHINSNRKDQPFVIVNTSTIPNELLEATLFGHTKGAFTGAVSAKKGLLEVADEGTIFLDEIGNISLDVQAKLLRAIQEKEFIPVGSTNTVNVDVRIIAATNLDLEKAVKNGNFREDLYYRLNVITIQVPTLRERKDDIPMLLEHFIEKYCIENAKEVMSVDPNIIELLDNYEWPGNVRELENVVERGVVLGKSKIFTVELLPAHIKNHIKKFQPLTSIPKGGISLKDEISKLEAHLITEALRLSGGVQKEAAKLLSLKPTTLNEMMKRLNLRINGTISASSNED